MFKNGETEEASPYRLKINEVFIHQVNVTVFVGKPRARKCLEVELFTQGAVDSEQLAMPCRVHTGVTVLENITGKPLPSVESRPTAILPLGLLSALRRVQRIESPSKCRDTNGGREGQDFPGSGSVVMQHRNPRLQRRRVSERHRLHPTEQPGVGRGGSHVELRGPLS